MSSLFAFLHHIAAFTLISMLVVEFVLIRETLSVSIARKIQLADVAFGISAGAVLIIGFLRVFFFEKGASYYFHSTPFLIKLGLFAAVGILSIYPTIEFASWKRATRRGDLPVVAESKMRKMRAFIHLEMVGVVFLILCAALMARGVGSF